MTNAGDASVVLPDRPPIALRQLAGAVRGGPAGMGRGPPGRAGGLGNTGRAVVPPGCGSPRSAGASTAAVAGSGPVRCGRRPPPPWLTWRASRPGCCWTRAAARGRSSPRRPPRAGGPPGPISTRPRWQHMENRNVTSAYRPNITYLRASTYRISRPPNRETQCAGLNLWQDSRMTAADPPPGSGTSPDETGNRPVGRKALFLLTCSIFIVVIAIIGFIEQQQSTFKGEARAISAIVGAVAIAVLLARFWWTKGQFSWKKNTGATVGYGTTAVLAICAVTFFAHPSSTALPKPPVQVTINGKPRGYIKYPATFSGTVTNLRSDQVVWTFNQSMEPNGNAAPAVYPNTGPCSVTGRRWTCGRNYVGGKYSRAPYRICAAAISTSQAFKIVSGLRSYPNSFHMPLSTIRQVNGSGADCRWFYRGGRP
jgi:type IV secretory pathway protease TraF